MSVFLSLYIYLFSTDYVEGPCMLTRTKEYMHVLLYKGPPDNFEVVFYILQRKHP